MRRRAKRIIDLFKVRPLIWRAVVVLLLFVVLFNMVSPEDIAAAFRKARPSFLMISLVLLIPNLLLQAWKWDFLLRTIRPRPPHRYAYLSLLGGFFLGAVSPARTGELGRGFFIPGCSKLKVASLTVLDKGFNHATTYTASLIALCLALPWPLKIAPFAALVCLFTLIVNIRHFKPLFERLVRRFSHERTVENALAMFDALSRSTVWGMAGLSVAFFLTYTVQYYFIIHCFTDLDWTVAVRTIPLVYAINLMMPITIGDLGVKEMASVKLLGPYGIAGGAAVSASLTQNVMTFLIPSIFGGLILFFGVRRGRTQPDSSSVRTAPVTEESHPRSSS